MGFLSNDAKKVAGELKKIFAWLDSGKAEAALETIGSLTLKAAPYVADVAALESKNPTMQEIEAAFQSYGVPFATSLAQGSTQAALDNLAEGLVQKNLPAGEQGTAMSLITAAVQAAKSALAAGSSNGQIQAATPAAA